MNKNEQVHSKMTRARIGPLILKLALPNTLGLLVIAGYSLADSYFVSSLGTDAGAAVGVTFSLHVLIQAVGYTLGMGAGSLLSRALGKKDTQEANRAAQTAFYLSILLGGIITALGLAFTEPLLRFLGASESVLPYAKAYVVPLLWAASPMCAVFVLSQVLRAEGRALYSMWGLVSGSVLNIFLDPILITQAGFGIAGASVATLISQILSLFVLISSFALRQSGLSLIRGFSLGTLFNAGAITLAGLPSLFRQGLSGLATILLNRAARGYGEATVTALSLVARIFLLVFSVCLGIGQGMMPVVGYNMGSENPKRMRAAFRFSLIVGTISMLLIEIPLFVGAETVLSWFHQGDTEVLRVGASALRAQSAVLFTHGIVTSTILYLQATGHSIQGTILASARQGIFFLPLIFFLTKVFGLQGLICTQPTADAFAFLFSLPFLYFAMKRLKKACLK